jgi:hypothetical protein
MHFGLRQQLAQLRLYLDVTRSLANGCSATIMQRDDYGFHGNIDDDIGAHLPVVRFAVFFFST